MHKAMLNSQCAQVDCAYYAEDMAEAQDQDPADRLRDSLKSLGAACHSAGRSAAGDRSLA